MKRPISILLAFTLIVTILLGPASAMAFGKPDRPTPKQPEEREFSPDTIMVKFKDVTSQATQATLLRQHGLERLRRLDLTGVAIVQVGDRLPKQAVDALSRRPEVEYAELDYIVQPFGYGDEPRFKELWGHNNTGQSINGKVGASDVDVNALEAAARTLGSPNLTVAVIDDGVDFSHPDLQGRQWINPGESGTKANNGKDDDANGYVDDVHGWDFCHGDRTVHDPGEDSHGTHVAGTIAGNLNSKGIVGIAPRIKVMALKFLGPECGRVSDVISAIQYAKKKGVKISNNSYGGTEYSQALRDAIAVCNCLFVAAAGNGGSDGAGDNNDTSAEKMYPASYDLAHILAVAAVDNRGYLGGFSNYGATSVDISAPGVDVLSSVPSLPSRTALALSSVGSNGGKAVTSGFGAEEIHSASKQASFMAKVFAAVGRGTEQVVLVDDDGSWDGTSPDVRPSLYSAIQSATGSAPAVIEVTGLHGPSLSQVQGKVVVWATGATWFSMDTSYNFEDPLTDMDHKTLSDFLNGGGKLALTGMNILYGSETSTFVTSTLGVAVAGEVGVFEDATGFQGEAGTQFQGEAYDLANNSFADPTYHDEVAPVKSHSRSLGGYPGTGQPATWEYWPGTSMAAPHATGAAALVSSWTPGFAPLKIKQVLMEQGKPLPYTTGKTVTGDIVDAKRSLDSVRLLAKAPVQSLVLNSQVNTSTSPDSLAVKLNWSAAYGKYGAMQGIQYRLQRSVNGGTYRDVALASPSATTMSQQLGIGTTYRYRVMAYNSGGNKSVWATGPSFVVRPHQENNAAIAYSAGWSGRVAQSTAYGGYVKPTTTKGVKASMSFKGRNVAVVMPKRSALGSVQVCLYRGTTKLVCRTIDLSPSSGVGPRKLVFAASGLNPSLTHKVVVIAAGGRTEVDAILVLR